MSNSHTPGPWTVVTRQIPGSLNCQPVIVHADPHPDLDDIARIIVPDSQRDGGRDGLLASANGRLIAAAPELLIALRAASSALVAANLSRNSVDCLREIDLGSCRHTGINDTLENVIREAIAKAEGRS